MQSAKITLVLGASINENRFSNKCIRELLKHEFPVEALGLREGLVEGIIIKTGKPGLSNVHTVTLYIGAPKQPPYYQYIIDMAPVRVIFNPGTENPEFEKMLEIAGIEVLSACSIMMLNAGEFFENNLS